MIVSKASADRALIEIPLGRGCYCMLFASEIAKNLPEDLLAKGLKRGKGIRRRRQYEKRLENADHTRYCETESR